MITTIYASKTMSFVHGITYSAILASDLNGGIGLDNKLPWNHPEDMKWFREHTEGKAIIMGANTFRSLGNKPLPKRLNIVISRNIKETDYPKADNLRFFPSIEAADKWIRNNQGDHPELCKGEVMVIGGARIYNAYSNRIDRVYKTTVCDVHDCDVFVKFNEEGWDLRYMNKPSYISPLKFEIWDKKPVFDIVTP